MTEISRKQLQNEYAALLRHLQLLRGLGTLSVMRIQEYRDVTRELGFASVNTEAEDMAIRKQIRLKYMKGGPKARMLYDEFREIDTYVGGPVVLYLCMAQALVNRYQHLRISDPDIALPDLDRFLQDNRGIFTAVQNLRDWALHSRRFTPEEEDVEMLFRHKSQQAAKDSVVIVAELNGLFQQLLEKIDEKAKQLA